MSMKGTRVSMEAEGDVDYSDEPPAIAMTLNGDQLGDGTEVRMVDGVMYLKTPMFGDKFVQDGPVATPPTRSASGSAAHVDLRSRPRQLPQRADAASTLVGEEEVDGESLRHYQVTMDPSAAAECGRPVGRPPRRALPETVTYDLWFDDDGLVPPDGGRPGSRAAASVTDRDVSDWRRGRHIEAPPARDGHGHAGRGRSRSLSPSRTAEQTRVGACTRERPTGQRPRMLPRMPFMLVGTGPLGIGMFGRLASSALSRLRMSVISAGLTWRLSF